MGPLYLPQPGDLQSCPQQAQKPTYDVWKARPRWHTHTAMVYSRDSGWLGCAQLEWGHLQGRTGGQLRGKVRVLHGARGGSRP